MKILIESNKSELNYLDEQLSIKQAKDLAQIYNRLFTSSDGEKILEDLAEQS